MSTQTCNRTSCERHKHELIGDDTLSARSRQLAVRWVHWALLQSETATSAMPTAWQQKSDDQPGLCAESGVLPVGPGGQVHSPSGATARTRPSVRRRRLRVLGSRAGLAIVSTKKAA